MNIHYQRGTDRTYPRFRVEYWRGDDRYKPSLHLHWRWGGLAHWVCVFLPEWLP